MNTLEMPPVAKPSKTEMAPYPLHTAMTEYMALVEDSEKLEANTEKMNQLAENKIVPAMKDHFERIFMPDQYKEVLRIQTNEPHYLNHFIAEQLAKGLKLEKLGINGLDGALVTFVEQNMNEFIFAKIQDYRNKHS